MAEGKKSFVLYCDLLELFTELSDQDAGQLIKHIFQYVNDQNPVTENPLVKLSFIPIKQNLKRDLKKWGKYIEKQSNNGKLGGRPKTQKSQAFSEKAKKADSVSVNVSVSDSVNVNDFNTIKENFFNDFRWKEKFCRDKNISEPELVQKMQTFISDIELREDYKNLKELKSHFTNLYNKQKNGKRVSEVGKTIEFDRI